MSSTDRTTSTTFFISPSRRGQSSLLPKKKENLDTLVHPSTVYGWHGFELQQGTLEEKNNVKEEPRRLPMDVVGRLCWRVQVWGEEKAAMRKQCEVMSTAPIPSAEASARALEGTASSIDAPAYCLPQDLNHNRNAKKKMI
jgi:hypothetical protein